MLQAIEPSHDTARPEEKVLTGVDEAREAARVAGLRYVSDKRPGIARKRVGRHFSYIGTDGAPVRDKKELERIKALGIPPAWTNVWIAPHPRGHIQATGRDARGRKQYRYHPRWRQARDETKYNRMILFGETLPMIRKWVTQNLGLRDMPRDKALATVVALLDITHIRVGNEEYARQNESFGLTTLRSDHVDVEGGTIHFEFRGKSGKDHTIDVKNKRLARIVQKMHDLPGDELFQYVADGQLRTIRSDDVNEYLHQITGQDFTAKDFRTWAGTVVVARALTEMGPAETATEARKNVLEAITLAAHALGNTPAICRKSYVHPGVIDAYLNGTLIPSPRLQQVRTDAESREGLRPEEAEVLALLRGLTDQDSQI